VTMGTGARRGIGVVASLLRIVGLAIVTVIVVHIVFVLLDANPDNAFARLVREIAEYFSLGLTNLFLLPDPKLAVALNFGVAAAIWFLITAVVVRLLRRI
jgi:hypothetical protein